MSYLSHTIAQSDPSLQELMEKIKNAPSLALLILAALQLGRMVAVKVAEEIRDRAHFFVFLDTIRHVYRSGRVPKIASQVGSMLNVRPVLTTASGVMHFVGVVRNKKHGIERLLKIMRDKAGAKPVHVAVTHAYAPADAEALKERIEREFNCAEIWVSEFSPLMGYACGTGALGIAFYCDK